MAKKTTAPKTREEQFDIPALLKEMRTKGIEQEMLDTGRKIRLRHLDAAELLADDKMPDELTPLVVRSVYDDLDDNLLTKHLRKERSGKDDALAHINTLKYVAGKAIMDGTKVEDLTLPEMRWIFRLVMGPADSLAVFRLHENLDVGSVDSGEDVPSPAE